MIRIVAYLFFVLGTFKIGGTLFYVVKGDPALPWSYVLTKVFWGLMLLAMGVYMLKRGGDDVDDPASLGRGR